MPNPNPNNPYHCDRPMRKNGRQSSGAQKYRCNCGYTLTEGNLPQGGRLIHDRALTQVERNRRYKLKQK